MQSRVAALASGRGSNLRALLDHLDLEGESRSASVKLVISDHRDAGALATARERGIATEVIQQGSDQAVLLAESLRQQRIDLVVLAGYLNLVPAEIVQAFRGRMINVHPALLPAFGGKGMYGARVHRAVLASGARVSGPTVHFVDEEYDHGPIIAQWPVPVYDDDTEESLAARVLRAEHLLLPRIVSEVAGSRIRLGDDGRARGFFRASTKCLAFILQNHSRNSLGVDLDAALAR